MQFQTVTKLLAIVGACALVYVTGEWLAFRGPLHKKAEPTPSTPMQEQPLRPTFYCEKVPRGGNEWRMCYAGEKYKTRDGYFQRPIAHCYYRSAMHVENDPFDISWSPTEMTTVCFPSPHECLDARENGHNGLIGKPPLLSHCTTMQPDEATE